MKQTIPGHKGEEFGEIDSTVTVSIYLVDHILELSFSGVLTERSHDSTEFLGEKGCTLVVMEPSPFLSKRAKASLN